MATTAGRLSETIDASRVVMTSRLGTIQAAVASPWQADYLEIGRMVPEKMAAFSSSGDALVTAWLGVQADWLQQVQAASALITRRPTPAAGDMFEYWSGSLMSGLRALEAGARVGRDALAPIHSAATANRRRLERKSQARTSRP